jgi:hypothetical protein
MNSPNKKTPYTQPVLEVQPWQALTGVSLPIGATLPLDPMNDFLSSREQP